MTDIFYLHAPCSLGQVLLATRQQAVCAVLLADQVELLLDELRQRFPSASLHYEADLQHWLEQLIEQIEQPKAHFELPLAQQGSAFQQRVWQALRTIACGQTRTYKELAELLSSHPRAIARACASNPVALLVPCHRVLASDGSLAGYRWGIARKAELLRRERALNRQT